MKRYILLPVLAILLQNNAVSASQLLFARDFMDAGAAAPFAAPEGLQFVIQFESPSIPGYFEHFGRQAYWPDQSSGVYDFNADNSPEFCDLAQTLTNGIDDELAFLTYNDFYGGGGVIGEESLVGFGNPDLVGNEIDYIRLVVHDMSVKPYLDPDYGPGLQWENHITWEFWGEPIPEPTTAMLLCTAALVCCRKKPGRSLAVKREE